MCTSDVYYANTSIVMPWENTGGRESAHAAEEDAGKEEKEKGVPVAVEVTLRETERTNKELFEFIRTVECIHVDMKTNAYIMCDRQVKLNEANDNLKCFESSSYLAFFGFCTPDNLGVLMRILEYALQPHLLHVAFIKPGNFEGILSMQTPCSLQAIDELLACFCMSIGSVELDGYMQPGMIACLERITKGNDTRGNMHTEACQSVREHISRITQERTRRFLSNLISPVLIVIPIRMPQYEAVFLHANHILYTPSHMLQ